MARARPRTLVVSSPAPVGGRGISWEEFLQAPLRFTEEIECLVLAGPHYIERVWEASGGSAPSPDAELKVWRDGPGNTQVRPFDASALDDWLVRGRSIVVLLPVLRWSPSPHSRTYDRPPPYWKLAPVHADLLVDLLGKGATVSHFSYEPARADADRLPQEFWANGLEPLTVPAVITMGARTFSAGSTFPLVRAEGHGATGGSAIAATFGAAKLLVLPTETWISPSLRRERPEAQGIVSPLLDAEVTKRLISAAEWFHATALTKLRDHAQPGGPCPCGATAHVYPAKGHWRLFPEGNQRKGGWILTIPGFEDKPVHLRRHPGGAIKLLVDPRDPPRGEIPIEAIEAFMADRFGGLPSTPVVKQLSLARKAICDRTDLCSEWMKDVLHQEGDKYVFDPDHRPSSDAGK